MRGHQRGSSPLKGKSCPWSLGHLGARDVDQPPSMASIIGAKSQNGLPNMERTTTCDPRSLSSALLPTFWGRVPLLK